jgi:hypothetical protein
MRIAALAALIFALWILQHPYPGIYHDAQLYTLQALSRVLPSELAGDVFLRHGSQDQFTLFGALYAAAIRVLGTGPAAALLTFLSHCAFAAALILLARRVLPPRLVYIGVGLVCIAPLTYGARKVFFLMETFITPRLLAEAVVVAGLAAVLQRRYLLACLAAALAALLHPIMALTGLAVAVFLDAVSRRQRVLLLLTAAAGALALFGVMAARGTQLRFDDEWWQLVHSGLPYLFPLNWRLTDWARPLVFATLLYAGIRHLPQGPAHALCRAALIATAAGIGLSIVGADLLRLVLMTQLQPWRILWLATLVAVLLAPLIAVRMWHAGLLARIALVALIAAYLLADERFAFSAALLAAALVFLSDRVRHEAPALRVVAWGMYALLLLALLINLTSSSIVARVRFDQSAVPDWMLELRGIASTGVIPALLLLALGWVLTLTRPGLAIAAAAGCAVLAAVFTLAALPQWTQSPFTPASHAAFAAWRARLPARAEVLWFDFPLAAWVLLERPSYASNPQAAGVVFSREAGMIMRDRLASLRPSLDHVESVAWRSAVPEVGRRQPTLGTICGDTDVRYVVTRDNLDAAPIAIASGPLPRELRDWKLYGCENPAGAVSP